MSSPSSRRDFLKRLAFSGAAVGTAGSLRADTEMPCCSSNASATPVVMRRKLGRIGTEVSILGLGLGTAFTRPFADDPEACEQILTRALDYGINYWDTARGYGPSEKAIGPVVAKNRDRIYLVSKSAVRSYDGFKRELEISLRDLKTDTIDLYHIHNLNPKKDDLEAIGKGAAKAAMEAREQGIIKHFGITGHSGVAILMEAIQRWDPDALLTVFPADRPDNGDYEDKLLPLARERNMGIIGMKTVKWARNTDLPGPQLIRYSLSLEGVACSIVGLDTVDHLDANVAMASTFTPMPTDMMAEMSTFAREQLALLGPAPWERAGYVDGQVA